MRKLIIPLIFLLLLSVTNAQTISIGVEPAKINVYIRGISGEEYVTLKLFNEHGDVDAEYTIELEEDLKDFVEYEGCDDAWCMNDNPILVPKGTTRDNPVTVDILFKRKTPEERNLETGILIYGKPVGSGVEGTVAIQPRIKVKVNIHQTGITTTTEEISEDEEFDWGTETTTTSIIRTQPQPRTSTVRVETTQPPKRVMKGELQTKTDGGFNWLWVIVPVVIGSIAGAGYLAYKFDLFPLWFPFIFLFLSFSIVKADSVPLNVTVGEVFDYFNAITGMTQTVVNDTVVKETDEVYLAGTERSGDRFIYYIANNRNISIFVNEIILANPMKPKEYRIGSITAYYTTHSGKEIDVEVYTTTELIHVIPHSLIEIEPCLGSNSLELDFNPNVVGFTVGLLPFLTAVGIVLFIIKSFLGTEYSVEMITGVILVIIIAIVLLNILIATV